MGSIFCRCSQAAKTVTRRLAFPDGLSLLLTAFMLLVALPCHAAEATVFPSAKWAEATPESQSVDSVKLNEAAELRARTVGADGARELVVIRHGRMIWKGDNIDKRHGVWSATKSFTSTVLGLLIADYGTEPSGSKRTSHRRSQNRDVSAVHSFGSRWCGIIG